MFASLGTENNWERMREHYYTVKISHEYAHVSLTVFL